MSKIYPCKGDTGITSLANGDRVAKTTRALLHMVKQMSWLHGWD